jgi:hypothetical protein
MIFSRPQTAGLRAADAVGLAPAASAPASAPAAVPVPSGLETAVASPVATRTLGALDGNAIALVGGEAGAKAMLTPLEAAKLCGIGVFSGFVAGFFGVGGEFLD